MFASWFSYRFPPIKIAGKSPEFEFEAAWRRHLIE
jgi:hypothetical protein